jgi:Kef-type K+ transport system membrane component KefB
LSATTLGIVIPVLKDAGQVATPFGQLVVAAASIAEITSIVLLSLFFSGEAGGIGVKLLLLSLFALFVLAVGVAVLGVEHLMRISAALERLQDTTAEIRIRASFLLLVLFAVLADRLGLEAILGAFLAGAIVKLVDRDEAMTHPVRSSRRWATACSSRSSSSRPALGSSLACATRRPSRGVRFRWRSGAFGI